MIAETPLCPGELVINRKEKSMKRPNTLSKLGHALTRYLKSAPVQSNSGNSTCKRNIPVVRNERQPCPGRKQMCLEDYRAQSTNCVRSRIVNADGSYITVEVFSYSSAHARRSYRKKERM